MRPAAETADHLDAVEVGQPEVEHDQVRWVLRRRLQRLRPSAAISTS
ncbi:MAG: hypothetical protein QM747_16685 [Nocardioides sp.]